MIPDNSNSVSDEEVKSLKIGVLKDVKYNDTHRLSHNLERIFQTENVKRKRGRLLQIGKQGIELFVSFGKRLHHFFLQGQIFDIKT